MFEDVLKINEELILESTNRKDVGVIGFYCEEGTICYLNDKLVNTLGYSDRKDIINSTSLKLNNIIIAQDYSRVIKELDFNNLHKGVSNNIVCRMVKKDGTTIWTVSNCKVVKGEDDKLICLLVVNEMNALMNNYKELEVKDSFSKVTFDNILGGYYSCGVDDGYPFLYISDRFLKLVGYTEEEIKSKFDNKFINMVHPLDLSLNKQFEDFLKQDKENTLNTTYRILAKKGYIWVSDSATITKVDNKAYFQGTLTDITNFVEKRKAQEDAIKEQLIVFDLLAKDFKNIYLLDLDKRTARILKLEASYVDVPNKDTKKEFNLEPVIENWINTIVYVEDREKLSSVLKVDNIKETLKTKNELVGNYRNVVNEEIHYYQYKITKSQSDSNIAIIGFQNIDDIIEEHLEEDRLKRDKEKQHQIELEEQLSIINALSYSFRNVFLADMEHGTARAIRIADNYNVKAITDVKNQVFPFDLVIDRWVRENVHPDDKKKIKDTLNVKNMREIFSKTDNYVGTYRNIENGVLHYYQFDCRRVGKTENVVVGFQLIDKIVLEQQENQRRERELERARIEEEKERVEVIRSLSTIYSTIFKANIVNHDYEILTSVPLMSEVVPSKGNFEDIKEIIINTFIEAEYKTSMYKFLDIDTLSHRLTNVNTVTIDYKAPTGQWIQARFIVKKRDMSGKAIEALYVARDVTDEKLIKEQAEHDALTGILNRGSFDLILKSLETSRKNFALILMDVDNFKTVNDTYGHAVGDIILKKVSKYLAEGFRSIDYVCRIGGDEFAVLMTNVTLDNSELIKDKIAKINDLLLNHTGILPKVSLSVGVAFLNRDNPSDSLFKDADRAMYHVKKNGRNGCHFYSSEDVSLDNDYREDLI